jgi:CxxC motif-containing protein (DUF1111 family)
MRCFALVLIALSGCGPLAVSDDVSDAPLAGLNRFWSEQFSKGDRLFDNPFRPTDGLGPVYIKASCGGCHVGAGRGPGFVERLVQVQSDGVTPVVGQPALEFGSTARPRAQAPATPLLAPSREDVQVRVRLAQPIFGRGYLDAVSDATIEAMAQTQHAAGLVSGRANHVLYLSEADSETAFVEPGFGTRVVGRFGLKARQATLGDFTADAFQGDMGLTSHKRSREVKNREGVLDDEKPGVDVDADTLHAVSNYVRTIAIPSRVRPDVTGAAMFQKSQCHLCHVPVVVTRPDYPIEALANVEAPIYTDILLHDLGPTMADSIVEGEASGFEWRTAPLIGLRFMKSYLHDGRASSIESAIIQHGQNGSEAQPSVNIFQSLNLEQRQALLRFVESL